MQGRSGWKYEEIKAIHLWGGEFTEAHNLSHRTALNLYKSTYVSVFFAVTERARKRAYISTFISISSLHFVLKNGCNQHAARGLDLWCLSSLSLDPPEWIGEGSCLQNVCAPPHSMHIGWSALKGPRAESRTRVGTSGASKIQTFIVSMSGNFVRLLLRAELKKCIMCS